MIRLGVDPGSSKGAAVVLDTSTSPARVVDLLAWSPGTSGGVKDLRVCGPDGLVSRWAPDDLQRVAAGWLDAVGGRIEHAAVEEPLSGHSARGAGAISTVTHATAGEWRGLIRGVLRLPSARPLAQRWRRDVLGLPGGLDGAEADARIARLMPGLVRLPIGLPKWAMKHIPDACGVALWVPR